jgi:hypothetical protein
MDFLQIRFTFLLKYPNIFARFQTRDGDQAGPSMVVSAYHNTTNRPALQNLRGAVSYNQNKDATKTETTGTDEVMS